MDFGIALAPGADAWKHALRAEELGLSHAWFYDTQLLCADVFVAMAGAALKTERIKLGTGVLIPTNRIAPSCADAFASLNQLAPGRIIFGVGTGFTGRRTMGLPAMRLDDMAEYVRIVRALLQGETVEWEFEGERRKLRFLNPELGLINVDDPVPVHISAFGPRSRSLTARLGDGWVNFMGSLGGALEELGALQAACRDAGRDPATCYTTVFSLGCVLREGEDAGSPRARAQAGPSAAVMLHAVVERPLREKLPPAAAELAAAFRPVYEGYPEDERYLCVHRGHLMFLRPDEAPFVTPELIRNTTSTATAPELVDRIRALKAAGYDQFTVQLVPGHEDAIEDWVRVFEKV